MLEESQILAEGTEVSAKYRGAYCEARVKSVDKNLRFKVTTENGSLMVPESAICIGAKKTGENVEVCSPQLGYSEPTPAFVQQVKDNSLYTVEFDDGDVRVLRRSQLCPMGDRHYQDSDTLDLNPLTDPEHFGTPVRLGGAPPGRPDGGTASGSDSGEALPSQEEWDYVEMVGRPMRLALRSTSRDSPGSSRWVPVLVVLPHIPDAPALSGVGQVLVRSFKDNRLLSVDRKQLSAFTRAVATRHGDDRLLRPAIDRALLYQDSGELPTGWNAAVLLGDSVDSGNADSDSEGEGGGGPNETEDHFVASLYNFMDERGTPINKAPAIANKDLNLYRLSRIVRKLGGYNRVTNQMKWRLVYAKMRLPTNPAASYLIRQAYKKSEFD